MFNIIIYEDTNGKSEIKDYMRDLQKRKDKNSNIKFTKIVAYIRMLSEYGLSLGTPYIKHISKEIWELRPLRDRILFAYYNDDEFLLLNIFVKKTQKTPKKEIEKAQRLLEQYKRRKE